MSDPSEREPFRPSDLESPVYRRRLMRKINTLIAVLEVATAKVRRSLEGPDADVERLERIESNLRRTLSICRKARTALERREQLPPDLPAEIAAIGDAPHDRDAHEPDAEEREAVLGPHRGRLVEMSSAEEAERLERLGPVSADEVRSTDVDELARRLLEDPPGAGDPPASGE